MLFSLSGNTLANFDDDAGLLTQLTTELLRPQDRLLLEVATTPDLSDDMASQATEEYETSEGFGEFVTSSLRRQTNLAVDKDNLQYDASIEDDPTVASQICVRLDRHTWAPDNRRHRSIGA